MTHDEKIRRGQRAAEILADELVEDALTTMREHLTEKWRTSTLGQRDERETLYFLHCGMVEFEAHFRSLISDGEMAQSLKARDEADRKAEAP